MYTEGKPLNIVIGENLTRILNEKNIGVNEFGEKMNMTGAAVSGWCLGKFMPSPEAIEKMCQVLNIDRLELITDIESVPNVMKMPVKRVPILGSICAGDGIIASQEFDGYFYVDQTIFADLCLRVVGDSMEGAQIYDGDMAFLKKDFNFTEGNIYGVVCGYDNMATLKRVFKVGNEYRLVPCNEKYESATIHENDPFFIVGELVGTYHRWR